MVDVDFDFQLDPLINEAGSRQGHFHTCVLFDRDFDDMPFRVGCDDLRSA